jgi:hypothetical protein
MTLGKDTVSGSDVQSVALFGDIGPFFHSRCIESMQPSISGQPFLVSIAKYLGVSSTVGGLKYFSKTLQP